MGKKPGRSSFHDARVVDISRAGACVFTSVKFVKGEPVTLYLQPSAGITKQVYAVVVRAQRVDEGVQLGLQYIDYEELVALTKQPLDADDFDYDEGGLDDELDDEDF